MKLEFTIAIKLWYNCEVWWKYCVAFYNVWLEHAPPTIKGKIIVFAVSIRGSPGMPVNKGRRKKPAALMNNRGIFLYLYTYIIRSVIHSFFSQCGLKTLQASRNILASHFHICYVNFIIIHFRCEYGHRVRVDTRATPFLAWCILTTAIISSRI